MKWRKSVWRKRKPQNNLESYMKNHLFAFWVLMMQPFLLFSINKNECNAKPHDFIRILRTNTINVSPKFPRTDNNELK